MTYSERQNYILKIASSLNIFSSMFANAKGKYQNTTTSDIPQLFIECDWQRIQLGQFKQHTADGDGVALHLFTPLPQPIKFLFRPLKPSTQFFMLCMVFLLGNRI